MRLLRPAFDRFRRFMPLAHRFIRFLNSAGCFRENGMQSPNSVLYEALEYGTYPKLFCDIQWFQRL
jgi:hypothetical protein